MNTFLLCLLVIAAVIVGVIATTIIGTIVLTNLIKVNNWETAFTWSAITGLVGSGAILTLSAASSTAMVTTASFWILGVGTVMILIWLSMIFLSKKSTPPSS